MTHSHDLNDPRPQQPVTAGIVADDEIAQVIADRAPVAQIVVTVDVLVTAHHRVRLGDRFTADGGEPAEGWYPEQRISVAQAFERFTPYSMEEALAKDMFDEAMVVHIEPHLGKERPTFICDYPA